MPDSYTPYTDNESTKHMRPIPSIGELLPDYLRESGLEKPLLERKVVEQWPEIMGPTIARYTRSIAVENGMLLLKLSNAALRSQLFEQRHELIHKINTTIGGKVITDVRLMG